MPAATHHQPPPSPSAAPTAPPGVPAGWEEVYLDALAGTGQKAKAARLAGISLRAIVRRRHQDSAFARLELEAMEAAFDLIESEGIRRAVEGVTVTRRDRSGEVTTRIIYSDNLLLKILEHHVWSKQPKKTADSAVPPTFPTAAARRAAFDQAMAEVTASRQRHLQGSAPNQFHHPKSPPA